MAASVPQAPLALPAIASRPVVRVHALPWPGAPPPGEGLRDPLHDRPPVAVFGAGLAVWGFVLAAALVRCTPPG